METETTLVDSGYASSTSSPRNGSFRNSDSVDFRDVFGGPPRRSSIHEMMRYSFSEGADSGRRLGATPSFRDPWTGAEEKPVFGGGVEEGNRRRGLREDFFVDIFGGTESPSSPTPRKHDRDVFPASPGSRTLSPAWPLAEGFAGLSSGPTQFSLPDKLSKSVDSPTFRSPTRTSYKDAASNGTARLHSPKVSVFGFSNRTVQVHDESKSSGPHYRPSPLSQRFSLETDSSFSSMKHGKSDDLEKETGIPGDVTSSPQFHFSIYKWASKGVPLVMPLKRASSLRSREKGKTESGSFAERKETSSEISEFPSATLVNAGNPPDSSEVENQSFNNLSSKVEVEACQPVENKAPSPKKQEAVASKRNSIIKDNSLRSAPNNKDEKSSGGLPPTNSRKSSEKEMSGGSRPELKPLHAFFQDKDEEQSNSADVVGRKTERTSRISKGSSRNGNDTKNLKKSDEELLARKSEEAKKVITKGSPRTSGESTGKRRTKGKVNEFIKIFNKEAPPAKPKTGVHPQGHSSMEKDIGTSEATEEAYTHRNATANEKVSISQSGKPQIHSGKVADPNKESNKEHSATDKTDILFRDTSSGPKNNSASSTVSVTDEDAEESSRTYFTIKELPQDENKQGQPSEDREEIQAIDDKIRQWSRGKEGNIRSLLSTLQYVLWPGSGWKPVPLANIIEGPAVKRAYQRALLSLHPAGLDEYSSLIERVKNHQDSNQTQIRERAHLLSDKLQQKGAAPNHKYIAEQVFDILQEAWTQFNTLGLGAL